MSNHLPSDIDRVVQYWVQFFLKNHVDPTIDIRKRTAICPSVLYWTQLHTYLLVVRKCIEEQIQLGSGWELVEHKASKCVSPDVVARDLCELLMTLTICNDQLAVACCDQRRSRHDNKKDCNWFREWTYLYHTAQNCRNRRCAHKCITISNLCIPEFLILTKQYSLVHRNKSQLSLHKTKS